MVGLLGAVLLGVVPVGAAAPAQAATAVLEPAVIDATISASRARYGDSFTVQGTTTCDEAPATGSVTLHRRFDDAPEDAWKELGTDTAARFSFTLRARGNADYSVVYNGQVEGPVTCDRADAGGPQKVYRRIPVSISDRLVYSGRVAPAWARKPVTIQVRRSGRWVTIDTVRTDLRSRWAKKLWARRGSRTHFRAVVPATARFQRTAARSVYTYYASGRVGVSPRRSTG